MVWEVMKIEKKVGSWVWDYGELGCGNHAMLTLWYWRELWLECGDCDEILTGYGEHCMTLGYRCTIERW